MVETKSLYKMPYILLRENSSSHKQGFKVFPNYYSRPTRLHWYLQRLIPFFKCFSKTGDGSFVIELMATKNFDVTAYSFLEGIVERATNANSYLPAEKQAFTYYIKSASLIEVMDGFEGHGYRLVNQCVDQNIIWATMNI